MDEGLHPRRRLALGVTAILFASAAFAAGRVGLRPSDPVTQPIEFNHQKHAGENGIECSTCHEYYSTSDHSGLPSVALCKGCHAQPLTKSREEQKLIAIPDAGPFPEFRKLFRLADHVRYSHQRHVALGNLPCATCHGDIANTTAPPRVPLVRISMDFCTTCHTERGVKADCTACHR